MFNNFLNFIFMLTTATTELQSAADANNDTLSPIYNLLTVLLPTAMGIIFAVGSIYGVVLGIQYAKASGTEEREKMKKRLISTIIGVVVIVALIALLFVLREPISALMS